MPATAKRPALPDPFRLQLRAVGESENLGAVDAKLGRISGVSQLTADREAAGHGVWIDQKTLETFLVQLSDRRIKAYATHGAWGGDGTLDEVGYWESPRIDGNQLRSDFQSLDAWRKHQEAEFDTLFELASKLPKEFGASLSFRMTLAWVRKDGTELATVRKWRERGMWDYEQYFDPAMPADALREMPSVRCVEVYSADFVCVPAANDGLFRAGPGVDGGAQGIPTASTQPALFAMNKELFAKFGNNPALLAQAMKLHTENETLSFAEIVAKIEGAAIEAELVQLRAVNVQYASINEALEKAGFKAAGEKSGVVVLIEEHASFKARAALLDADEAALKAAGFEAKDGKSAASLALAALKQKDADIATLRAGGTVAINTGTPPAGGASVQLSGLAKYEASVRAKLEAAGTKN
jgi:hypothetical protein